MELRLRERKWPPSWLVTDLNPDLSNLRASAGPHWDGGVGWISVKVCRMKLVMREAQRTCKFKGPGRLRCIIHEPFRGGGRSGERLVLLRGSPLLCMHSVPKALDQFPLLLTVCGFAWGPPVLWVGSTLSTSVFWPSASLATPNRDPFPRSRPPSKDHQH